MNVLRSILRVKWFQSSIVKHVVRRLMSPKRSSYHPYPMCWYYTCNESCSIWIRSWTRRSTPSWSSPLIWISRTTPSRASHHLSSRMMIPPSIVLQVLWYISEKQSSDTTSVISISSANKRNYSKPPINGLNSTIPRSRSSKSSRSSRSASEAPLMIHPMMMRCGDGTEVALKAHKMPTSWSTRRNKKNQSSWNSRVNNNFKKPRSSTPFHKIFRSYSKIKRYKST